MQTRVDRDAVFVTPDHFVNLQESDAVFGNTHDFCVAAAVAMVNDGSEKHVSYIGAEDLNETTFALKEGGKIPKVTIEWVDASEADPENHKQS